MCELTENQKFYLTNVLLNLNLSFFKSSVDPDQMASDEAI